MRLSTTFSRGFSRGRAAGYALLVLTATAIAAPAAGQAVRAPERGSAGDEPVHFRVDMHIEADGRRYVIRRYVDGARSRMEAEIDGQRMTIISTGDAKGTTYVLMPSMKRAVKASNSAATQAAGGPAHGESGKDGRTDQEQSEAGLELLGAETIEGTPVEKYRVSTPLGTGLMWIETSTQRPVRMEAADMKLELKNYDFSRPAPELFEVPKGYELVDTDQMMKSFGAGGMLKTMASGYGGQLGGQLGGSLGGQIGGAVGGMLGGPVGAMVGRFVGERIGERLGQRAGRAVVPK